MSLLLTITTSDILSIIPVFIISTIIQLSLIHEIFSLVKQRNKIVLSEKKIETWVVIGKHMECSDLEGGPTYYYLTLLNPYNQYEKQTFDKRVSHSEYKKSYIGKYTKTIVGYTQQGIPIDATNSSGQSTACWITISCCILIIAALLAFELFLVYKILSYCINLI
jgi:hypothetical protein